ncbi:AAA family ATPase [Halodesulfovibrio sp.]|uniref:AAA family ATPase n=1 Tax=Halodesulfovibrio sp. TaxID=1912772 RepID=UPI0025C00C12|nr:AAA family ATPase [Halodesulfovibrio sp.]
MLSQLDKQSAVVRIEEEFKYASSGMLALKSNARRGWIDPQVRFPPDSILLHDELDGLCSVVKPHSAYASEKKSRRCELEYYLSRFSCFNFPKMEEGYMLPLPWEGKLSFVTWSRPFKKTSPTFLTSDLLLAWANADSPNINWIAWDGDIERTSFEKLKGTTVHLFDSGSDFKLYRKNMHLVYRVLARDGVKLDGFIRASGELGDSIQYEYESITYAQHQYGIGKKRALKSKYVVQSIDDISADNVAVNYVDPVFSHPSISMIYADPGVGKTWFALALALACSTGVDVFPKWSVPEALNVLYVDGETGAQELGKRIQKLKKLYPDVNAQVVFICTSEMNIATEGDQKYLESVLKGHQKEWNDKSKYLLILDNLSTLTNFDDSVSSWNLIFSWLKKMKDDGINSIIIHHPNKKGDQRGSSIKTATLDNVLKLERFTDGSALDFSIKIEKARAIERKHQRQFNVELKNVDRNPKWVRHSVHVTKLERDEEIVRLSKEGCREQVVADKVDCSIATVKRVRRKFGLTKVRSTK